MASEWMGGRWAMRVRMGLLAVVLVAGCREEVPYPRLADGAEAYVFAGDEVETRVDTEPGKGFIGSSYEMLANGTRVMVLDDRGDEADPRRIVQAKIEEKDREGLAIRVERAKLRRR